MNTKKLFFLICGFNFVASAFSMKKDVVEITGKVGERRSVELDSVSISGSSSDKDFLLFKKFQKFKNKEKKKKDFKIETTGSFLGDIGIPIFIKEKEEEEEEEEERIAQDNKIMKFVSEEKEKNKVEKENKIEELVKNKDEEEKKKKSVFWDSKRWLYTLGATVFTVAMSCFRGQVISNDIESLTPMSDILAYGSCLLYPVTALYIWWGKDKVNVAKKMYSEKKANIVKKIDDLDTRIRFMNEKYLKKVPETVRELDETACQKYVALKENVFPYVEKIKKKVNLFIS